MNLDFTKNPRFIYKRNIVNFWKSSFSFKYEDISLKTKKSNNLEHILRFQTALAQALIEKKRRTYKADVAINISIEISQKDAPSIHNICKNYIDLICKPHSDLKSRRKYLLLRDDLQIKYLNVIYTKSHTNTSSIMFDINSYKLFLERIHLVKWFKLYSKRMYPHLDDEHEEATQNNSIERYYRGKKQGEELFWIYWLKREAQNEFFHNTRIKNNQLVDLFCPVTPSQRDLYTSLYDEFTKSNLDDLMQRINLRMFNLDFGKLPEKSGEGSLYKSIIVEQIDEYLANKEFLSPILIPLSISIITKQGDYQHKDLDNIAREIIKTIMDKLKPPTSFWSSLNPIEKVKFEERDSGFNLDAKIGKSNFPKIGFISYQVIYLPKQINDNSKFVRLNIHDANYFRTFQNYLTRKMYEIEEYGEFY